MDLKNKKPKKRIYLNKILFINKALMFLRLISKRNQLTQSFCAAQNIRPKSARTFRGKGTVYMEHSVATAMMYLRPDNKQSLLFPLRQRSVWSFITKEFVYMENDVSICI